MSTSSVRDLSIYCPLHKSKILVFMYYAEVATKILTLDPAEKTRLETDCPDAATEFCQKLFHVDIRPDSIATYYNRIKQNTVDAHVDLDHKFTTRILPTQITLSKDYDETVSFLQQNFDNDQLSGETHWLIEKAFLAQAKSASLTTARNMRDEWQDIVARRIKPRMIADPVLKQRYEEDAEVQGQIQP